ncbi:MAG: 4Fe-4S binding protein [Bacteroidales bacterium]|nr:4Fe-4S binding protein [Bacteroidales bacterium]
MKRQIIKIDEDKCNGCGICIPNCHEGALQMIDNKARLISDLFCDGLGACIGHCPEGAIEMIEREAEPYDEIKVMKEMVKKGKNTIVAHLNHLKDHGADEYLNQALDYLKEHNIDIQMEEEKKQAHGSTCGCPGSAAMDFREAAPAVTAPITNHADAPSELRQWPVQLHLLNPNAPYFKNADVVLAADCTAFAMGGFHSKFLKGKTLAIACPKLDSNMEVYVEKIAAMVEMARINTLSVVMMEVPCCSGLLQVAKMAVSKSGRNIPIKKVIVSIQGQVTHEDWA